MVEGNSHKHSRILLLVSIPNLSQKLNQIEKLIINMSKINNKDLLIRELKQLTVSKFIYNFKKTLKIFNNLSL